MNTSLLRRPRPRMRTPRGAALGPSRVAAAVLALCLLSSACSAGWTPTPEPVTVAKTSTSPGAAAPRPAGSTQIELRVGDEVATATLEDTAAARRFAAMLPLELTLRDPMGQAASGPLPRRLETSGADRLVDPEIADLYYWPPSGAIAIFHKDLGHRVPAPGLVRLGAIEHGMDALTSAGNRFTVRIERA